LADKVFVVDDDREFVEVVRTVLEANGYEVAAAYSGEEARGRVIEEQPDVIILDVMMETKTAGFDMARWLRDHEETDAIPVVMLTAVNQEYPFQFGPDSIWLPVDKFLEKPVSPERLLAEVERACTRKPSREND